MIIDPTYKMATTNWSQVPEERHEGATGFALWKTTRVGDTRVRMVTYSPNYMADHWCEKGHIILCLEGSMTTELKDGRTITLTPGVSYQVGDGADAHRTFSSEGVKLFIVD
ncbi:MAG: DHCW motif cupin fold protein [Cyclobacteriaceae bacterium]|nr:DHCW motif cupin fold protein [Cyclobacteriaceae bacterium]